MCKIYVLLILWCMGNSNWEITITNAFQNNLDESDCKANIIWVD